MSADENQQNAEVVETNGSKNPLFNDGNDDLKGARACKGKVKLVEGVSTLNFYTMLLVSLMTINFLVFLNAMQGFLLRETFDVDSDDLGQTTGYLGLADEVWSIITLALWGAGSDKLGRRTVVSLGFVQIGIASFIIPVVGRVFPGLLFARLLYAQGASALTSMISALLADYVQKEDAGRATGLVGLMSGLGALLAVFVFVTELPPNICIQGTYFVNAVVALVMACISFGGLSSLSVRVAGTTNVQNHEADENLFRMIKEGLILGYKNKRLGLAYLAGFLARGDSIIGSIFISLWINREFEEDNLCGFCSTDVDSDYYLENCTLDEFFTTCDENFQDEDEITCPEAYTRFRILSGVSQVFGLFVAPLVAIFGDRFDPVFLFLCSSSFSSFSYFMVFSITSVEDSIAIFVVILWGMASISMVLSAQYLLLKNMPEKRKGTVAGCFSVVGAFGVMFFTYFGGLLFDEWFFGAPFALAGFVSLILFFCALKIYKSSPSTNDEKEEEEAEELEKEAEGSVNVSHYT